MREHQDSAKRTLSPPPTNLGRKYIRRLLEAFEPHQDAMVADLDRRIEASDPDIISRKSSTISDQWLNKVHRLDQVERTDGTEGATFTTLLEEIDALGESQMTLREQFLPTLRQNSVLTYTRNRLVELLQVIHTIHLEGNWENIWDKEKYNAQFSLLGERFLMFSTVKQQLRLQTIEDIDEWMRQKWVDFVPTAEETKEQASTTKKPTQRKRPVATKQPQPSPSPSQIYARQAWVRLLVSAHHYSSHFQDHLGELGVFVYDEIEGKPHATLYLWTNGAKQQFPVVKGAVDQQEALSDSIRAWLAMCWVAATGEAGREASQ